VALAADEARARDWRGWVENQLDLRAQAVADYERVLELQPGRFAVRLRLAQLLVESSRHAEAVPHLERLLQEQPDHAELLVALADCRVVQTKIDEARHLLDRVLAAHPEHFDALLQRGKTEMIAGEPAEAERWLRKALERAPQDPDVRYALYLCLQAQPSREGEARDEFDHWKRDRQARDRLTRLLRVELDARPSDPDLAEEAGELFLQQGEEQKGLFWLHRALALDSHHAASHRALSAYYERTNDPVKAAEHREKLAAIRAEK
jgi:tetratricopeptide (TPR) repeat protein